MLVREEAMSAPRRLNVTVYAPSKGPQWALLLARHMSMTVKSRELASTNYNYAGHGRTAQLESFFVSNSNTLVENQKKHRKLRL